MAAVSKETRKVQVVICKCGATFAASTVPECYTDEDWIKEVKAYVENGCSVDLIDAGTFHFTSCTCEGKKERQLKRDELKIERSDFDITDLDTDDLIVEVESRGYETIEADTLDDKMKVELFNENFRNVTMKQLETFFNDPDNMKTMQEVNKLREENQDLSNKVDELENKIWELEE